MEASDSHITRRWDQLDYLEEPSFQLQTNVPPTCKFQNEETSDFRNVPSVPLNNGILQLVYDLETLQLPHLRKSIEFRPLLRQFCRKCSLVPCPNPLLQPPCWKRPWETGSRFLKTCVDASAVYLLGNFLVTKNLSEFVEFSSLFASPGPSPGSFSCRKLCLTMTNL